MPVPALYVAKDTQKQALQTFPPKRSQHIAEFDYLSSGPNYTGLVRIGQGKILILCSE
jgi:hypothetical protein